MSALVLSLCVFCLLHLNVRGELPRVLYDLTNLKFKNRTTTTTTTTTSPPSASLPTTTPYLTKEEDIYADLIVHKLRFRRTQWLHGNAIELLNPLGHFSVHEPIGQCGQNRSTVSNNAKIHKCLAATNGGYFDNFVESTGIIHQPRCFGSLVSRGRLVQGSGRHSNVHFGVTSRGQFFVGYVTKDMLLNRTRTNTTAAIRNSQLIQEMITDQDVAASRNLPHRNLPHVNVNDDDPTSGADTTPGTGTGTGTDTETETGTTSDPNDVESTSFMPTSFMTTSSSSSSFAASSSPPSTTPTTTPDDDWYFEELIAGVVWLVRDGVNYVEKSLQEDDMSVQLTGNEFSNIVSARTALAHTADGRLFLVTIDGKSYESGVNLVEFSDLLIELGASHAINLDGGGSATVALGGEGEQAFVANFPSDQCQNQPNIFTCERAVTTITCIHDTYLDSSTSTTSTPTTPSPTPSPTPTPTPTPSSSSSPSSPSTTTSSSPPLPSTFTSPSSSSTPPTSKADFNNTDDRDSSSSSSSSSSSPSSSSPFSSLTAILSSAVAGAVLLTVAICMIVFIIRQARRFRRGEIYTGISSNDNEHDREHEHGHGRHDGATQIELSSSSSSVTEFDSHDDLHAHTRTHIPLGDGDGQLSLAEVDRVYEIDDVDEGTASTI